MKIEVEKLIGKKIKYQYSDHDLIKMGLPKDYSEIFIATHCECYMATWLLFNNKDQYVTYEYAINNLIK